MISDIVILAIDRILRRNIVISTLLFCNQSRFCIGEINMREMEKLLIKARTQIIIRIFHEKFSKFSMKNSLSIICHVDHGNLVIHTIFSLTKFKLTSSRAISTFLRNPSFSTSSPRFLPPLALFSFHHPLISCNIASAGTTAERRSLQFRNTATRVTPDAPSGKENEKKRKNYHLVISFRASALFGVLCAHLLRLCCAP